MDIINFKHDVEKKFTEITDNKQLCDHEFDKFTEIISKISSKYSDLFDNTNNSIIGIDSCNFQNKLFELYFQHLKKNYNMIQNRIYGDYYKIYRQIKKYIESIESITIIDISFTTYKDLVNDKLYDFNDVIKLQNTIHHYIKCINDLIHTKNINILQFLDSNKKGYDVNYYINEEKTNIQIYSEKNLLFINYLNTCNLYHNKYLLNLLSHIGFYINHINNEINLNDYKQETVKKELLSQLKKPEKEEKIEKSEKEEEEAEEEEAEEAEEEESEEEAEKASKKSNNVDLTINEVENIINNEVILRIDKSNN